MAKTATDWATEFREYVRKMLHFEEAINLMYWDLRTGAPKKGVELRSEAIGTLAAEVFAMQTSPQMEEYLNVLSEPGTFQALDPVTQATVREVKKEFDRNRKIPADRFKAYVVLTSQAESVWEEAKKTADFASFRPYLEKIVAMKIEFIGYWGYQGNKYNTLLDQYEPGLTVEQLDGIFGPLREETVKLVQAIVDSGIRPDLRHFRGHYPKDKQRALSLDLLRNMGYDFAAGRLDETEHPFQTTINRYDARVTTKFLEDDLRSAISSTVHEGGHALYEQGVSPDLIGTPLCTGASMGIHESQSRFYENMIGRSHAYWESHLPVVRRYFPEFEDVSVDEFYRAMNDVSPSLIRIEADEVTYNLHIMIRYELEKALINETLRVADLPGVWREKMREYLGVEPDSDATGVLQDVHWSGGDFGYFPSYSLGNIYAAQFRHQLAKEIPDYMEQVRRGEMLEIKRWLNEKIHRFGKTLTPGEIVRQATGEDIDAKYLIDYLHEKFDPLYNLA
ncbi:carboxypeptidase M32 [Alicyclobacillus macrosporangiidus]|uniref:carboxypeptidase M32 n=1 Tax=Alicyclobacillus macrosporangiidus TaxID=392015 RepID=UPI0026ED6AAB|nr:carboxypeptidase M32 [Alicyclobacillus macrosporangiidus]